MKKQSIPHYNLIFIKKETLSSDFEIFSFVFIRNMSNVLNIWFLVLKMVLDENVRKRGILFNLKND